MTASGPFAMPSNSKSRCLRKSHDAIELSNLSAAAGTGRARAAPGPDPMAAMHADRKPMFTAQGESYSDDENDTIIDLEVVPEQSGESAPTGLIRSRSMAASLLGNRRKSVKTDPEGEEASATVRDAPFVVKEEPASPEKQNRALPRPASRKGKGPAGRTDDRLGEADLSVDMDVDGNRIEPEPAVEEQEQVAVKSAIDLDEIIIEDYEEDITGDFVQIEGEVCDQATRRFGWIEADVRLTK